MRKLLWHLINFYIAFWPLALGLILLKPDPILNSTKLFFKYFGSCDNCSVDISVILFWTGFILWPILYFIEKSKSKRENLADIQRVVNNCPDLKTVPKARIAFDGTYKLFYNQDWSDSDLADPDFKKFDIIYPKLLAILNIINDLVESYFQKASSKVTSNFMIYIPKSSIDKNSFDAVLNDGHKLYFRENHGADLQGVLALFPELHPQENQATTTLLLPIYPSASRVYNHPANNDDAYLPGAPAAHYVGESMIPNTRNNDSYSGFDEATVKQIVDFFMGTQTQIKTLCSFKIPDGEGKCVGILNIDASEKGVFGEPGQYIGLFYTLIYPLLKTASPFLTYFCNYKMSEYNDK